MDEVRDLVERAASGDWEAWSELVDRFANLIWSVARSVGLNASDAADVSQTTWLRFCEHLGDLNDPSRAGAWLATTARREAIRVSRLGARQVVVDPWTWLEHSRSGRRWGRPAVARWRKRHDGAVCTRGACLTAAVRCCLLPSRTLRCHTRNWRDA